MYRRSILHKKTLVICTINSGASAILKSTAIIPPQPLRNPIPRKGFAIRACQFTLSPEEKRLIRVAVTTLPFWHQSVFLLAAIEIIFQCLHTERIVNRNFTSFDRFFSDTIAVKICKYPSNVSFTMLYYFIIFI